MSNGSFLSNTWKDLKPLVEDCFKDYNDLLKVSEFVIPEVVPILYFGNLEEYQKSKVRIITAAINPSDLEFKKDKNDECCSDYRFEGLGELFGLQKALNDDQIKLYLDGLNGYFVNNPYDKWFSRKTRLNLFKGLDASYKSGENIVIHTDIVSPFATNPTWTKKPKGKAKKKQWDSDKKLILEKGNILWKKLIDYLSPDIILMSLKRDYYSSLKFELQNDSFVEYKYKTNGKERDNVLKIEKYTYSTSSQKRVLVYNESITNCVPFNGIGSKNCEDLGLLIREDSGLFN